MDFILQIQASNELMKLLSYASYSALLLKCFEQWPIALQPDPLRLIKIMFTYNPNKFVILILFLTKS